LIGLSELLPELEAAKRNAELDGKSIGDEKLLSAIKSFQEGARAFSQGNFSQASASFKQVLTDAPESRIAEVAWDTAKVASEPSNPGTERRVKNIINRLPPLPQVGEGVFRIPYPISCEDILKTFSNGGGVSDLILWNGHNISDEGVKILCETLPGLKRLSIRKAKRITDGAIPYFCKHPLLERLLLWGSKITQAGMAKLQRCRDWDGLNLR
jgi:hypothetical protein